MATQTNLPFSWDEVDRISDLNRLQLVLDALPDGDIIDALRDMRKNGRDEYPVSAMWKALIAGIVLQHESVSSLIRELNRNSSLLAMCGFSSVPRQRRSRGNGYKSSSSQSRARKFQFLPISLKRSRA